MIYHHSQMINVLKRKIKDKYLPEDKRASCVIVLSVANGYKILFEVC